MRCERLLVEDPLLGLAEQVRSVAACDAQMVAGEVKSVTGEQLLRPHVVERGPFEFEKHQQRPEFRGPFLHSLEQRAALGVRGVGREAKAGVGAGASHQIVDHGELLHGIPEARCIDFRQSAAVALSKALAPRDRVVQQHFDLLRPAAVEEITQIPMNLLERDGRPHRSAEHRAGARARPGQLDARLFRPAALV